MFQESNAYKTNPEKAASRVAINGMMLASLFVVLAIILSDPAKFDLVVISQMVLAVPLLFISSLAYAKIGYWKETYLWDTLGYFTNTMGNMFLINAIGVMVSSISIYLAFAYFLIIIVLLFIYSTINVIYARKTMYEKIFKFLFSTLILVLGGLLPIILLAR